MKLQKLTIHNIASIEDAVIDFEAEPLASSEVFLITGKTGSGKSTILDAICLALFADTPRLDGTQMQGNTKDADQRVGLDDPRQLMRRNTGEAFVTLTFVGSNGVHYEATWKVWRAGNKSTGNLQSKAWNLKNLDTDQKYEKDLEIRAEIKAAIGLDFNQFCRTTMLAQGEFTKFLNSKDVEKAAILEKITGMDIYTRIGRKIYEITTQKETLWKEATQQVEGVHTLSDEEIAAKNEEMAALTAQHQTIKDAAEADKVKLQWIQTDAELAKAITAATTDYQQAQAAVESEDFKAKEKWVNDWTLTIDARNWLKTIQQAEQTAKQQKGKIDEVNTSFVTIFGPGSNAESAKMYLETEDAKIKEEENAIEQLGLPNLRGELLKATNAFRDIQEAQTNLTLLENEKKRAEATKTKLTNMLAEIGENQKKLEQLIPQIKEAEQKRNTCKELFEQQKDTIDKFAQTMRQKLHLGDICPVCGQTIEAELPHEDALAKLVNDLSLQYKTAEQDYENKRNEGVSLHNLIQTMKRNHQRDSEAYESDKSVENAAHKLAMSCDNCGIAQVDDSVSDTLSHLLTEKQTEIARLNRSIHEGDQRTHDAKTKKDELEKKRRQVANLHDQIVAANIRMEEATKTIADNRRFLDAFLAEHDAISESYLTQLNSCSAQMLSMITSQLNESRNICVSKKTLMENAIKKQEEHRSVKPELQEEETSETLATRIREQETAMGVVAEKKGAIMQELTTDADNKNRLCHLIEEEKKRLTDYQKWMRINQLVGDATGNTFRKIAQSYVLSSLIHSANSYMKTLTDRYTLKVAPGSFVITLEDAYQGYVSRAASTISGGESFLVSLSLALALSDIGQQLAVDTLFIDEGFGTLSGEPLQNAINTLRSLHSRSGRHVGIISHVEELRDTNRIPVQILVEQDGNSSSSTIRVIPQME